MSITPSLCAYERFGTFFFISLFVCGVLATYCHSLLSRQLPILNCDNHQLTSAHILN